MGFIVILPFAAMAIWIIITIFRWLHRLKYGLKWRNTCIISVVAGLAIGSYLCFVLQYHVADKNIFGFPIPLAISTKISEGNWNRAPLPTYLLYPAIVTNLAVAVALGLVPIAIAAFFKDHRTSRHSPVDRQPESS